MVFRLGNRFKFALFISAIAEPVDPKEQAGFSFCSGSR